MIAHIEIIAGSRLKTEMNKSSGLLQLDRIVPVPYPANYGFVPGTLSEDGDPIDCFVFCPYPLISNIIVKPQLYGVIVMLDDGVLDEKLVMGLDSKPRLSHYKELIKFLKSYKSTTELIALFDNPSMANEYLTQSVVRYHNGNNE